MSKSTFINASHSRRRVQGASGSGRAAYHQPPRRQEWASLTPAEILGRYVPGKADPMQVDDATNRGLIPLQRKARPSRRCCPHLRGEAASPIPSNAEMRKRTDHRFIFKTDRAGDSASSATPANPG